MPDEKLKDPILPIVLIIVLGAAVAGVYYWIQAQRAAAPPEDVQAPSVLGAGPNIRHPLDRPEGAKPLPPLNRSDAALHQEAAGLSGEQPLDQLFFLDSIVRRVVVTVDALPRGKMPQRYNLARPVDGRLRVRGDADSASLQADNAKRYAPYVRLAESLDTGKWVALYVYFYPLLQEEYENLGFRDKYFNDRVVEAIDDMLAAPDVKQPVKLVRPNVMYEYADPELEALSAGQKIMIRMGPENAAKVKAKLREIRHELASPP